MVDGHVISDVVVSEAAVICEFLQSEVFSALDLRTLSEVADKMGLETHPAGTVLVRQGDPGDKFYLIRSGTAVVTVTDAGRTRRTGQARRGDSFGEAALIEGEPATPPSRPAKRIDLMHASAARFPAVLESSDVQEQLLRILFARQ